MEPLALIGYLLLALVVVLWGIYLYEAFRQDIGLGLLLLLLPVSVYYFCFVRSMKGAAMRLALVGASALWLVVSIVTSYR